MSWKAYAAATKSRPDDRRAQRPANDNRIGVVKTPGAPAAPPRGPLIPRSMPVPQVGAAIAFKSATSGGFLQFAVDQYIQDLNQATEGVNNGAWARTDKGCGYGPFGRYFWGKSNICGLKTYTLATANYYDANFDAAVVPYPGGSQWVGEWSDWEVYPGYPTYRRAMVAAQWFLRAGHTIAEPFWISAPARATLPIAYPFGQTAPSPPARPKCGGQPAKNPKYDMPPLPGAPLYSPSPEVARAYSPPKTSVSVRPGRSPKPGKMGDILPKWPKPPKKKALERKVYATTGAGRAAWVAANTASEAVDLVAALHSALPKDKQADGYNPDPFEMAEAVYENFDDVDMEKFLEALANDQIEDFVYGSTFGRGGKLLNQTAGNLTGGNRALAAGGKAAGEVDHDGDGNPDGLGLSLPQVDFDFPNCRLNLTWN